MPGLLPPVLQELLPAFADIHPTENRYARMVRPLRLMLPLPPAAAAAAGTCRRCAAPRRCTPLPAHLMLRQQLCMLTCCCSSKSVSVQQAEHMMEMAGEDVAKEDKLSLDRMLMTPHAFYGVVHDHDEL